MEEVKYYNLSQNEFNKLYKLATEQAYYFAIKVLGTPKEISLNISSLCA